MLHQLPAKMVYNIINGVTVLPSPAVYQFMQSLAGDYPIDNPGRAIAATAVVLKRIIAEPGLLPVAGNGNVVLHLDHRDEELFRDVYNDSIY